MGERRKLFNFRPAVLFALCVIFGIVFAFIFFKSGLIALLIPAIFFGALIFSLFLFFGKLGKKLFIIIAAILLFALSGLNFYGTVSRYSVSDLGGHYCSVDGRVKSATATEYGGKFIVTDVVISGKSLNYDIALYVYGDQTTDVGDKVRFFALLEDETVIYEGKFSAENVNAGVRYSALVKDSDVTVYSNYKTLFEKANVWIRETLKNGLGEDEFPIAYAMLTGNDSFIDSDALKSFRSAGVAHVFAVSGLHIGFVALILSFFFNKIKCNEILSAVLTVLILTAYSGVCGFSASSLRATVMCAVLLFSRLGGFRYDGLSSISLSAALILLFSPVQLFCAGFELSFTVVIFIALFTRPLAAAFKFLPRKLATSLGAVVSAFFAGIPISLVCFGKFSLLAVPLNLVFIPIAGVIFIALFLLCFVGGIFSFPAILFPLNYVLKAVNAAVTFFDYDIFLIGGITLGIFPIFYYSAFLISSGLINIKRSVALLLSAACLLVFIVGSTVLTVAEYNKTKGYITGSEYFSATVITQKSDSVMIVADAGDVFSLASIRRLKERKNVNTLTGLFITDDSVDAQRLVTRLLTTFKIETVFIFGSEDIAVKTPIEKSFPDITVVCLDYAPIKVNGFSVNYAANGKAAVISYNDKKATSFSRLKDFSETENLPEDPQYSIVYDSADASKRICAAEEIFTYRRDVEYLNGESEGIYTLYFA